MHNADAGNSPWGSVERLQALANLLCIAGGEPALLEALQPAVHGWLTLGASGGTHDPDMQQRHLILGTSPLIALPIVTVSGSAFTLQIHDALEFFIFAYMCIDEAHSGSS